MFQLLRFKEDEASHVVDVMVQYEWRDNEIKRLEHKNNSRYAAWGWINHQKLIYGTAKLKAYILHKKVLSEKSAYWSTSINKANKLRSLEIMIREREKIEGAGLSMLAHFIVCSYAHLVNILPEESSVLYTSSRHNLKEIREFADEIIYHEKRNANEKGSSKSVS
jgi:hypothetical protein